MATVWPVSVVARMTAARADLGAKTCQGEGETQTGKLKAERQDTRITEG